VSDVACAARCALCYVHTFERLALYAHVACGKQRLEYTNGSGHPQLCMLIERAYASSSSNSQTTHTLTKMKAPFADISTSVIFCDTQQQ
jgi:hypothetical protein